MSLTLIAILKLPLTPTWQDQIPFPLVIPQFLPFRPSHLLHPNPNPTRALHAHDPMPRMRLNPKGGQDRKVSQVMKTILEVTEKVNVKGLTVVPFHLRDDVTKMINQLCCLSCPSL